ncbi:MAG: 2-oxo acid dehydrogenase subunit E2 [Bryobacteraceae bacterium]
MPLKTDPELGINSWLEDEFYQQYLNDRTAVDESWKHVFEDGPNIGSASVPRPAAAPSAPAPAPASSENLQPLRGIAAKIAENMNASVTIPLATSQRVIPVKVMDENRRIINQHRTLVGKSKVSYTHLIGWAILKALGDYPGLDHAYGELNGQPARIVDSRLNWV